MPPTVLVADDNLTVQRMASEMLSEEGMDVITVANGMAAIKKLPDVKPLVIVADVDMPGKNGYEVCDFVKSQPELDYVRVLLVVSDSDPLDGGRGAEVRADGVVKKPFDRQAFVSLVVKSLGEAQALCPPTEPQTATAEPESPAVKAPVYEEIEHTEILDLNQLERLPEPLPLAAAHQAESPESFQPFVPLEPLRSQWPPEPATSPVPFEHEEEIGPLASNEIAAIAAADLARGREEATEIPPTPQASIETAAETAPAAPAQLIDDSGEVAASPATVADDLAFHPPEEHDSLEELSEPPIVDWPASFMAPLEPLDPAAPLGGSPLAHTDSLGESLDTGLLESPLPDLAALAPSASHEPEHILPPLEPLAELAPPPPPDSAAMEEAEAQTHRSEDEASTLSSLAPLPAHLDTALTPDSGMAVETPAQSAAEEADLKHQREDRGDSPGVNTAHADAPGPEAPLADDLPEPLAAPEPVELPDAACGPGSLAAASESSNLAAVPPVIDVLLVSAVIHAVVARMAPPALPLEAIQSLERQLAAEIMPDLAAKPCG